VTVEGPFPQEWLVPSPSSSSSPSPSPSPPAVELRCALWSAPVWVPDLTDSLASGLTSSSSVGSNAHGSLQCPNGLFPCPLPVGADPQPVLNMFRFMGRLMGKALVDGYLVPLRLHPAFFQCLRAHAAMGGHANNHKHRQLAGSSNLVNSPCSPVTATPTSATTIGGSSGYLGSEAWRYLCSPTSHLVGCKGAHVALLFQVLPLLERAEKEEEEEKETLAAEAADAEPSAGAPLAETATTSSSTAQGGKQRRQQQQRSTKVDQLLDRTDFAFTKGLQLREWLEFLPWADPVTNTPLPLPPIQLKLATRAGKTDADDDDDDGGGNGEGRSAGGGGRLWWEGEVTGETLLFYLRSLQALWLGEGIQQQVGAFLDGLGAMASLDGGVLAFESEELRDLLCGPDTIEWTEESLKRKHLRPKGDFKLPPSQGGHDTLGWLRVELVELDQQQRLRFMELTTGLRVLTPDKVITVRRTNERWPYFHSCTNQLDLPRYQSQELLREGLLEALANGSAGGFSEIARLT